MNTYQTIDHLLTAFHHIRIANSNDNQNILNFYQTTEMKSEDSSVIYKRGDNFFNFLEERSEHFIVFLLENDEKN